MRMEEKSRQKVSDLREADVGAEISDVDEVASLMDVCIRKIVSRIHSLEEENEFLRSELERQTSCARELENSNAYLRGVINDHSSVKTDKALGICIDCISTMYNEILDATQEGDVLADNAGVFIEELQHDLEEVGIQLDYHKRGAIPEGGVVCIIPKKTGIKQDDGKVVRSRFGFRSEPYIEGMAKKEELTIYAYEKSMDETVRRITVTVHQNPSEVRQIYSDDVLDLPICSDAPPGMVFKGWALSDGGTPIPDSFIRPKDDIELFPVFEPKTCTIHIRYSSECNVELPEDEYRSFKIGEKYRIEFGPFKGCIPSPAFFEGQMGDSPLELEVVYKPCNSRLIFDEHFRVDTDEGAITSNKEFDEERVSLSVRPGSNDGYVRFAVLRNLRGSIHHLNCIKKRSPDGLTDYEVTISFDGDFQDNDHDKGLYTCKVGMSLLDIERIVRNEMTVMRLTDHECRDSELHLIYSPEIKKYWIRWTASSRTIKDVSMEVKCGTTPESPRFDSIINLNDNTIQFFIGWDRPVVPVSCDCTYTAKYADPVCVDSEILTILKTGPLYPKQVADKLGLGTNKVDWIKGRLKNLGDLVVMNGKKYQLKEVDS